MSYQALYRKWRPQVFADVKGQDHIVKTLQNQIGSGRIGHAYLFCGTRGTGKTTVAKILARAVKEKNPATLFHVDAIQSYGKLDADRYPAASGPPSSR